MPFELDYFHYISIQHKHLTTLHQLDAMMAKVFYIYGCRQHMCAIYAFIIKNTYVVYVVGADTIRIAFCQCGVICVCLFVKKNIKKRVVVVWVCIHPTRMPTQYLRPMTKSRKRKTILKKTLPHPPTSQCL